MMNYKVDYNKVYCIVDLYYTEVDYIVVGYIAVDYYNMVAGLYLL